MQLANGNARYLNCFAKETGGQDVRAEDDDGASGRLDEVRDREVSEDVSLERQDGPKVLNGSATDCCNCEEVEEEGSFSEDSDSTEDEASQNSTFVRDGKLETDGQLLPDEGWVTREKHAHCEWQFPSTSSIFWRSAKSSGSLASVLKSSNTMTGADMDRGCSKCSKCNGTGKFPGKIARDYRETEESRPIVGRDHGHVSEEGSKPRPVNQRSLNVSAISSGIWLKCFFRFFLGSIVEDLIISNPFLTSLNVILLPISFVASFCGDMLFLVLAIYFDLVFMTIYIFFYFLWMLNVVFAICWHFLQLSSFSTRVAKTIFEFLWDMRAAYNDDEHFCKVLSSRQSTQSP